MVKAKPVGESLKEYTRGITGGLIFSFPLLYTMEVWWSGFIATPQSLLALLLFTMALLIGYNRYAGLRPDASWKEIVIDSVEELGLGLILAFGILFLIGVINIGEMSINEIAGKVIVEAMAVSIGVSIGTAQLGAGGDGGKKGKNEIWEKKRSRYWELLVLAACGSVIVGGNVAPTEEIPSIAFAAHPIQLLVMALLSLLISVVIVFFSDFKGSGDLDTANLVYRITFDTAVCYAIALGVSAFMLWFFGRFENTGFWDCFSQTIVLGLLSSLGASAGRLLIK